MKKFIAFFILSSIVFMSLPTEWMHDCDHVENHETKKDVDGIPSLTEKCFACDYHFDVFGEVNFRPLTYHAKPDVKISKSYLALLSAVVFDYYSHRGPPMI